MKRFDLALAIGLIPIDFLALTGAAITAYFLRFEHIITQYRPVIFDLTLGGYLQLVVPVAIVWLLIFAFAGLYRIRDSRRFRSQVKKIFVACLLGFAAITILIFLRGELFNSRFIVLAATLFAIVYVTIARFIVWLVRSGFYKIGIGTQHVILVGNDKNTEILKKILLNNPHLGLRIVEQISTVDEPTLSELKKQLGRYEPDIILQATAFLTKAESEDLLDFAREHHLDFHYVADLFETKAANADIATIGDIPVIEIKQTPLEGWGRIYKRTFDLVAGGILTIVSLPVMAAVAIAIKLEDGGPIFYKNQRVGKNGDLFWLYKFRRLKPEFCTGPGYDTSGEALKKERELIQKQSHREGPLYKISDDPRGTRVGKFIEQTSLDELPQFFNVLAGSMSLVGPRPHQPREVDLYQKHHKRVLGIKPGVTGMAQISGRSDLDFEEEVRLDTYYMENWSLRLDLSILLKTPLAVLKKHNA